MRSMLSTYVGFKRSTRREEGSVCHTLKANGTPFDEKLYSGLKVQSHLGSGPNRGGPVGPIAVPLLLVTNTIESTSAIFEKVQVNRKCGSKNQGLKVIPTVLDGELNQESVGVSKHLPA